MLYHCKYPEKPGVILFRSAEMSAVKIGGTTIHSNLGIKPGTKLLGLYDESKAALKNRLAEVKCLIINELSMVSNDLWTDIASRLGEIVMVIPEKEFAGLSVMVLADFFQLPPARGKLIFFQFSDKDSMKHLLCLLF